MTVFWDPQGNMYNVWIKWAVVMKKPICCTNGCCDYGHAPDY